MIGCADRIAELGDDHLLGLADRVGDAEAHDDGGEDESERQIGAVHRPPPAAARVPL